MTNTSNNQNLPFLGIIAVGGSLSEAAIAYHDAAIGQKAVAITDRDNSFLFMSNTHPDETVMSNPITGELDLRDVPQALSAVQFQSKSSAKVAARYTVCAGDDGKSGCGTHLIYDCKDVIKYCPMCNESLSSERTDEEISDILSYEELGDVITAPEDLELDNQEVSESASDPGDEDDDDEDDEDIAFNDISDDDDEEEEDDEDYESKSSGLTDFEGDADSFDLSEMTDDEVAEFEGTESPYDNENDNENEVSQSASADDTPPLISDSELEAIRDELIREARQEARALSSKSSTNMLDLNKGEFVVSCDSIVAISRTQTKALNKYRALLVSKVPMSIVAASDSNSGFATLASDAKVFRHSVLTGSPIDGNTTLSLRKSPQFIESLSSNHDHSIADLYQCTAKNCGVYIVTSAQSPEHCPMCASDLKDPDEIEDAIIPVLDDGVDDDAEDAMESKSNNDIDDSAIDLDDFDISSFEDDDTEAATSESSANEANRDQSPVAGQVPTSAQEQVVGPVASQIPGQVLTPGEVGVDSQPLASGQDDGQALAPGQVPVPGQIPGQVAVDGKQVPVPGQVINPGEVPVSGQDLEAIKTAKEANVINTVENDAVEDYDKLVSSSISAQRNKINMSLLAEAIPDDKDNSNSKAEFLNVVYCGSLTNVDSNNQTTRNDTWTAFYKGSPVAFATLASSVKHKDIFHDPAFAEATLASAKVNGIRQSLEDMGFKPYIAQLRIKDNINKLVASQIEIARNELLAKTESDFSDYDQRLLTALSTAAVGINRGFFRNLTNPIKVALWNSLSAAGVRNPETLIDNVFSTQADSYHKTLFEKAKEIVSKPLEIQNELTAAVVGTNYTATAGTSSFTANQTVEDSLQMVGHPTTGLNTPNSVSTLVSTSGAENHDNGNPIDNRILKVVSSLGRRR